MSIRLLLIFVTLSFLLGFWCGTELQHAQERYEKARLSYPAWMPKERALELNRKVGPGYPLRITSTTVAMFKDEEWIVIRRRGI